MPPLLAMSSTEHLYAEQAMSLADPLALRQHPFLVQEKEDDQQQRLIDEEVSEVGLPFSGVS